MSAIFGFTGPRDDRLLASMADALAGRAPKPAVVVASRFGAIAHSSNGGSRGEGVAGSDGPLLAFAGSLRTPCLDPKQIVERYLRDGLSFLCELRGDYVGAILDGESLHLFRDGAGARSIYFAEHEGRVLFSIEPKGLWSIPGFPRRIRPAGVAQYLTFSFQPTIETLLEGIRQLPSGHIATFQPGSAPVFSKTLHFEEFEGKNSLERTPQEWAEELKRRIGAAVEQRLENRPAPAAFLSGGLDSSLVVYEAARRLRSPLRTFSLHFGKKYPHELEFARMVAERCRTDHVEVEISPKGFLPNLRRMVWYLDDPIGDPVTVGNFELARHVSGETDFVLNGEGGDPCFGGPKNLPMMLRHWYGGEPEAPRYRERQYLTSYRRGYQEFERLLSPEWLGAIDQDRDLESILTPYFETDQPKSFLNKLMAINIRMKGAQLILPKVERLLAAWGIAPLSPLFDEEVIRLSFAMPPGLKLRQGIEKWILKRAYERDLPEVVIERPKSGMRVPVHFWFQGEMKRYAGSLLSRKNVERAGIFNAKRVQQLLRYETEERDSRHGLLLWMLITFEIWRRIVVEREAV